MSSCSPTWLQRVSDGQKHVKASQSIRLTSSFFLQLAHNLLSKTRMWELWRESKCLLKILVFPPPSQSLLLLSFIESCIQAVQELLTGLLKVVGSCDQGCLQAFPSLFPSHLYLRPQLWRALLPVWPPLSNQCLNSHNTSSSTPHWTATCLENHVSKQDNTSFFSCHPGVLSPQPIYGCSSIPK